jgi:hypothetical protein
LFSTYEAFMLLPMPLHEYITVGEMAAKHRVSRKRILQMVNADLTKRDQCQIVGDGIKRPTLLLLPARLFAGYQPVEIRQRAGKAPKSLKKKSA